MNKDFNMTRISKVLFIEYGTLKQIIKYLGLKEKRKRLEIDDFNLISKTVDDIHCAYGKVTLSTVNEYFYYHGKESQR